MVMGMTCVWLNYHSAVHTQAQTKLRNTEYTTCQLFMNRYGQHEKYSTIQNCSH